MVICSDAMMVYHKDMECQHRVRQVNRVFSPAHQDGEPGRV